MSENPYQSPQQLEGEVHKPRGRKKKLPWLELATLCWIITILLSMVMPAVQSSQPRREQRRQLEERNRNRASVVLIVATSISTATTLCGIVVGLRNRLPKGGN